MAKSVQPEQITKLYKSYMTRASRYVPRHRGKSPYQIAYFARSVRVQQETVWLASLLSLLGAIPAEPSADGTSLPPSVARGEALCNAFEMYRVMVPFSQISFEHAVFLATTLSRGEQLRLGDCADCGGLVVTERFPIREKRCHHCSAASSPR
jgi:hypothetical protein